jgi:hypothetical protein
MPKNPDTPRNLAIGCFMLPLGVFSGAMVAVLVGYIVAYVTRAESCPDIPTCDWYIYAGWGALIGGLTLPALVLRRIYSAPPSSNPTDTNRS